MGASDCDCLDGRAKRGHQGNHSRLRGWGGGVATNVATSAKEHIAEGNAGYGLAINEMGLLSSRTITPEP